MRSGKFFPTPCLPPKPARILRRGLFLLLAATSSWAQSTLVLGITGGWEPADAPWAITTRINALSSINAPADTHFASISNHRLEQGRKLIRQLLDTNHDRKLSPEERSKARIILYGQSMGGAGTIKLCRWLNKQKIPVLLNVQIDSVGVRDGRVPPNVAAAANLYQHDLGPIRGQSKISAQDPAKTRILGNWRYSYPKDKLIDTTHMPIGHRLILNPHLKMEFDPEVALKVTELIRTALEP